MELEALKGKKVSVVGLGPRTGVSLVRYLSKEGALVSAYDRKAVDELSESISLLKGVSFLLEAGKSSPTFLSSSDLIILSPGVPSDLRFLEEARKAGKKIISEIEFSSERISAPLVVITGTNGKSTTTSLIQSIFEAWGKKSFAGGNLGNPLVNAVGQSLDFVVAEVSSFQLEAVDSFHPNIGILLNISPNHLDRHGSFENYAKLKERIFARMEKKDIAILNANDPSCQQIAKRVRANVRTFSSKKNIDADAKIENSQIVFKNGKVISLKNYQLLGIHNAENAAAAALAADALECPVEMIEEGLRRFPGLPHRLEAVAQIKGVLYVNDSKSTSPEATISALEAFSNPVVLMLGGRSKGANYRSLAEQAARGAKKIILFGEAAKEMQPAFQSLHPMILKTMKEAFDFASSEAQMGDVVLFSPANASFDEFRDYEDRGEHFKQLVADAKKARGE